MDTQTFKDIDVEKWERIAKSAPVPIPPNKFTGTAEKDGFIIKWFYDKQQKLLTIKVIDKPYYFVDSIVRSKIETLVRDA